jgi:ribosomal protein S18 acetylase RimI-like enzyme
VEALSNQPASDAEEYRFGHPPTNLPKIDPPMPTRVTDIASVKIEVVDLKDKRSRARFIDMAPLFYAGDPNFIAPLRFERMRFLDPAHSPAFETLEVQPMLAHYNGKVAGRITAHIDRAYNEQHGSKTGWFGFFECINDRKVAHAMLDAAASWLKARGQTEIIGPLSFTTNHPAGLLVENFDRPPFVEMTYNPRYYEELLTSFGFAKAKDLLCWWIDVERSFESEKVQRVARIAEKIKKREGVTLRGANMADFANEVERIFQIYNSAWEKNWGFVKVSKKELTSIVNDLKQIVLPELVLFVEVESKPVAFACTLPNINQLMPKNGRLFPFGWYKLVFGKKSVNQGRLFTLGVIPEYRKRGLESMLFVETVTRCQEIGIKVGEIGWTLEDNDLVNRAIDTMEGRLDRRYRLLGMSLE